MKKQINRLFASVALVALTLTVGCDPYEINDGKGIYHAPAVKSFSPATTPTSGKAPGTEVIFEGVSLDNVSHVTFTAENETTEFPAAINSQAFKRLAVAVPTGDFPQDVITTTFFKVYDINDQVIYTNPYYVKVPLTDAYVSSATPNQKANLGTTITLAGQNLDKVTGVVVGPSTIARTDFVAGATATQIKVVVPFHASYVAGENTVALKATWEEGGTPKSDIVINSAYVITLPKPTAPTAGEILANTTTPAVIGDEVTFAGEFLTLYDSVYVDGVKASIQAKTDGTLTVKIANVAYANPTLHSTSIVGYHSPFAVANTLWSSFQFDATPLSAPVTPPAFTAVTSIQDGYDAVSAPTLAKRYYLKKEVTISGTDLDIVDSLYLGDYKAPIKGTATATSLTFTVPDDYEFTTAVDCELVAYYNNATEASFATDMKVYPFYFWKGKVVGAQGLKDCCFMGLTSGNVYTTDQWATLDAKAADPTYQKADAAGASGSIMNPKNVLNKAVYTSAADWYAVEPYFFISVSTSGGAQPPVLQSTSNSSSQLKNFKTSGGSALMSAGYGSSMLFYKIISAGSGNELIYADSVRNGSITNLLGYSPSITSGIVSAPGYVTTETATDFALNSVIMAYMPTYTIGAKLASGNAATGLYQIGFIHVREINGVSEGWSTSAKLTFDIYWPKNYKNY